MRTTNSCSNRAKLFLVLMLFSLCSIKAQENRPLESPSGKKNTTGEGVANKAAGKNEKDLLRRIGVALFRAAKPQFKFGAGSIGAVDLSRRLNQKLVSQLAQSGKFRVLDHQFDFERDAQLSRLKDGKAQEAELARIGKRIGADYMLVGVVNALDFKQEQVEPGFGLPNEVFNRAAAIVEFRLIDTATQEVLHSNELNLIFDHNELIKMVPRFDGDQLTQALIGRIADEIINEIMELIHPIKVMGVDEERIILNQGGKRVRVGSFYRVEGAAIKLVDPDSGLKVEVGGRHASTVLITSVSPKYSIAKVVEGSKSIEVGQVCRRTQVKLLPAPKD